MSYPCISNTYIMLYMYLQTWYMYIYIYTHTHVSVCVCVCVYGERKRSKRQGENEWRNAMLNNASIRITEHSSTFCSGLLLACMKNPYVFTFYPSLTFFWMRKYAPHLLVYFYEMFGIFLGLPQRWLCFSG